MPDDHTTTAEQLVDERDDTDAAVVVTTDGEASSIGGHIAADTDGHPAQLSLWMLALHIDHVTRSARGAGGDATHIDTVEHALKMLQKSARGDS